MVGMAAPGTFDLVRKSRTRDRRIVQGSTFYLRLSFPDDWGADWTGFAARAQLRRNEKDRYPATVLANVTAAIVDPGPTQRLIDLHMAPETTESIKERRGTWDVEIYNGTNVYRVVQGVWELNKETTQ